VGAETADHLGQLALGLGQLIDMDLEGIGRPAHRPDRQGDHSQGHRRPAHPEARRDAPVADGGRQLEAGHGGDQQQRASAKVLEALERLGAVAVDHAGVPGAGPAGPPASRPAARTARPCSWNRRPAPRLRRSGPGPRGSRGSRSRPPGRRWPWPRRRARAASRRPGVAATRPAGPRRTRRRLAADDRRGSRRSGRTGRRNRPRASRSGPRGSSDTDRVRPTRMIQCPARAMWPNCRASQAGTISDSSPPSSSVQRSVTPSARSRAIMLQTCST
jgi:hypothetical protein